MSTADETEHMRLITQKRRHHTSAESGFPIISRCFTYLVPENAHVDMFERIVLLHRCLTVSAGESRGNSVPEKEAGVDV